MGRTNQQRRAAKKRRARPSAGTGARWTAGSPWPGGAGAGELLEQAVAHHAHRAAAGPLVDRLAVLGLPEVGRAAAAAFERRLTDCWEGGWQPAEVVRLAGRRHRDDHADVVVTALAVDGWRRPGTVPPAGWTAQLEQLGVERWWGDARAWLPFWARRRGLDWRGALWVVVETLAALSLLPRVAAVGPPPSAWGPSAGRSLAGVDEVVLAKIRALLAKAESTTFEAEAAALTAKAQELMARHAVDDAVARSDGSGEERPVMRRLPVDDPYSTAKVLLLNGIAQANGVRTVGLPDVGLVAVIGFAAELDAVELLFTSLLVQATRAIVQRGRVTDGSGRSRTRSWRQSFLIAYGDRIYERLVEASATAHAEAEVQWGRSLLPVLAGRDEAVREAVDALFPRTTRRRGIGISNPDGWRAGRIAAQLATLGPERGVLD